MFKERKYHQFRQWCDSGLFKFRRSAKKDQAIGSSRGGKNTKVHVIVNEKMQLMSVSLTGGQIHDSQPAIALLSKVNLEGKTVLADRAYSSVKIRNYLEERGAVVCIPDKFNFKG